MSDVNERTERESCKNGLWNQHGLTCWSQLTSLSQDCGFWSWGWMTYDPFLCLCTFMWTFYECDISDLVQKISNLKCFYQDTFFSFLVPLKIFCVSECVWMLLRTEISSQKTAEHFCLCSDRPPAKERGVRFHPGIMPASTFVKGSKVRSNRTDARVSERGQHRYKTQLLSWLNQKNRSMHLFSQTKCEYHHSLLLLPGTSAGTKKKRAPTSPTQIFLWR